MMKTSERPQQQQHHKRRAQAPPPPADQPRSHPSTHPSEKERKKEKGENHQHRNKKKKWFHRHKKQELSEEQLAEKRKLIEDGLKQQRKKEEINEAQRNQMSTRDTPHIVLPTNQEIALNIFDHDVRVYQPFRSKEKYQFPNIVDQLLRSQTHFSVGSWAVHQNIYKRNANLMLENFQLYPLNQIISSFDFHPQFGYLLNGNSKFLIYDTSFNMIFDHEKSFSGSYWNHYIHQSDPLISCISSYTNISILRPIFQERRVIILDTLIFRKPVTAFLWTTDTSAVVATESTIHSLSLQNQDISLSKRSIPFISFDPKLSVTTMSSSPSGGLFLGSRAGHVLLYDHLQSNSLTKMGKMKFCLSRISFINENEFIAKDISGNITSFDIRSPDRPVRLIQTGNPSKLDPSGFWISPDKEILVTSNQQMPRAEKEKESEKEKELLVYSLRHDFCCIHESFCLLDQLSPNELQFLHENPISKILFPSSSILSSERFCCVAVRQNSLSSMIIQTPSLGEGQSKNHG